MVYSEDWKERESILESRNSMGLGSVAHFAEWDEFYQFIDNYIIYKL